MPTEFENCPQCGRKGMVPSQAIWSWFPTAPHGFVESLSWQQTGVNLSSRMEKVKDARSWAALPLVAVFLFHRELPTYADVILIVATIATYLWASDRHKSAIRKVIDDFFPGPIVFPGNMLPYQPRLRLRGSSVTCVAFAGSGSLEDRLLSITRITTIGSNRLRIRQPKLSHTTSSKGG
jgi:hypothetical protein